MQEKNKRQGVNQINFKMMTHRKVSPTALFWIHKKLFFSNCNAKRVGRLIEIWEQSSQRDLQIN